MLEVTQLISCKGGIRTQIFQIQIYNKAKDSCGALFTIVNNNDDVDASLNMCQAVLVLFTNFHEASHSLTRAGLKDRDAEWDEKGGSPLGA